MEIGVSVTVKKWFFDSELVKGMLSKEVRAKLLRWGAYGRKVVAQGPKRRSRPSRAGETPTIWTGQTKAKASGDGKKRGRGAFASLRNALFALADPYSVVFGPVKFGRASPSVPNRLEFGTSERTPNRRRSRRRLGSVGEIRIGGRAARTTQDVVAARTGKRTRVTFGKLRNAAQVARANRLNQELHGPMMFGTIKPRPWVKRAVDLAKEKFGDVFAGSVAGD